MAISPVCVEIQFASSIGHLETGLNTNFFEAEEVRDRFFAPQ